MHLMTMRMRDYDAASSIDEPTLRATAGLPEGNRACNVLDGGTGGI